MKKITKQIETIPTIPQLLCEQATDAHLDFFRMHSQMEDFRSQPLNMVMLDADPELSKNFDDVLNGLSKITQSLQNMLIENGWKIDVDEDLKDWQWHKVDARKVG